MLGNGMLNGCFSFKENELSKQTVWRAYSESNNSGYFVWEITEVMPSPDDTPIKPNQHMVECRDGSYVVLYCFHFWVKESALRILKSNDWPEYCNIYYITGKPDLTLPEYFELIKNGE